MSYLVYNKTKGTYYVSEVMPTGFVKDSEHLKVMQQGVGKVAESKIGEKTFKPVITEAKP